MLTMSDNNWRNAKGIMSSDLIEIEAQYVAPYKTDEWSSALAGLAEGQAKNNTHLRLHNTISYLEHDLIVMRDEISKIAERAEIDGAKHIAKQLYDLLGNGE